MKYDIYKQKFICIQGEEVNSEGNLKTKLISLDKTADLIFSTEDKIEAEKEFSTYEYKNVDYKDLKHLTIYDCYQLCEMDDDDIGLSQRIINNEEK